jgi:AcrR family transcriptional regulator
MRTTKQRIASDLHSQFSEKGFATQGVEALRAGSDVSIRTLYKHFPSREAMIVGALEHRDAAYFDWLSGGPETGVDHVVYPLIRLGDWLQEVANTGCSFMNALAEHRESAAIAEIVSRHKNRMACEFSTRLRTVAPDQDTDALAQTLFLLHEGMTYVAPLQGPACATRAALRAARAALTNVGIE